MACHDILQSFVSATVIIFTCIVISGHGFKIDKPCYYSQDMCKSTRHCWYDSARDRCTSCYDRPCDINSYKWETNCRNVCPETHDELTSYKDKVIYETTTTTTPIAENYHKNNTGFSNWYTGLLLFVVTLALILIGVVIGVIKIKCNDKNKKGFQPVDPKGQKTKKGRLVTQTQQTVV